MLVYAHTHTPLDDTPTPPVHGDGIEAVTNRCPAWGYSGSSLPYAVLNLHLSRCVCVCVRVCVFVCLFVFMCLRACVYLCMCS